MKTEAIKQLHSQENPKQHGKHGMTEREKDEQTKRFDMLSQTKQERDGNEHEKQGSANETHNETKAWGKR